MTHKQSWIAAIWESCPEITDTARACRRPILAVGFFSIFVNVLYLISPIYMMQIYNRVLSSANVDTLVLLTVILIVTLAVIALLDYVRSMLLVWVGRRIDVSLGARTFDAQVKAGCVPGRKASGQTLRDLDSIRQFLTGAGVQAAFDAPWVPIYILFLFILHPALGTMAAVCAGLLLLVANLNNLVTRPPLKAANESMLKNYAFTEASLRNAEAMTAMGMVPAVMRKWATSRDKALLEQADASRSASSFAALTKFLRILMQSLILGLAAYLVIHQSASAGAVFASSLLLGRALAPVEHLVGVWKQVVDVQAAFRRLVTEYRTYPTPAQSMPLPRPQGRLTVDRVSFTMNRGANVILRNVSFGVEAGEVVAVVGPSAAGKSSLMRLLVGVWRPDGGVVRLDGSDMALWNKENLGPHIGYLPQDIELFAGTVQENIARFSNADPEAIVSAAKLAGAHELILGLPKGYDTEIGDGGVFLSAGQRQRIGLVRAVFGNPSLVVLDEPNSNLDSDGEVALRLLLQRLKQDGASVVMVSHRASILDAVDKMLVLREGQVDHYGSKNEVLALLNQRAAGARPVSVVHAP
ncbi:type I secretion system permease/ATPase [Magnetospirillum sp. SS-4]|uniref:type I secretion system permease/ATPase n=1 Tax=Magnetospirillum sp. SS-4 TaxID=2681465 RepID=UPI001383CFF4|nr:type I secretion system permease/ATPase [Magnetospirillum sp. SS-4]CAA7624558.1 Alkaline protease secretion ATP-binding protein AprD [Magnetospirillum sp. SS-4]